MRTKLPMVAASLEVPAGWQESVAFRTTPKQANGASFAMTEEALNEGEALGDHVERLVLRLAKRLSDFELGSLRETRLGGLAAVHVRFAFSSGSGRVTQTMTFVARNGKVTSFGTRARGDTDDATRAALKATLRSVRFEF